MFVPLLVVFLILGMASNIISVSMKRRLIENGAEGLSWWARDFRVVNRLYRDRYPDSVWPTIDRYLGYLLYALFAAFVLSGVRSKE